MNKEVQNWLDSARYDLETAEHLFQADRYIYTVFMCHLALEKALKVKVEEVTGKEPPKTHDLTYLMNLSGLSLDKNTMRFISRLSNLSVVTRYPRDFQAMLNDFSGERAEAALSKTIEVFQWIENTITS
ncbi:HEPN domain-containing protein [Candidatus Poribacteria bacterium]